MILRKIEKQKSKRVKIKSKN